MESNSERNAELYRLYVEEHWTLASLSEHFRLAQRTIYGIIQREAKARGVKKRSTRGFVHLGLRVPSEVRDAIALGASERGITMSKFIELLILEGFIQYGITVGPAPKDDREQPLPWENA